MDESTPLFSTTSGVASAIGQGSHSFTNVQLARYTNTIASDGVNYELTLIDKIVDINGNEQEKEAKSVTKLEIADSTLDAVQKGMNLAATSYKLDSYLGMSVAAKTGTAQESTRYPDHALIISYAPYENPEISMCVNIQYGYSSSRATELARTVYDFYFGRTTLEQILAGTSDGPAPAVTEETVVATE